ncbi:MAG TPA: ATP-binding protein [Phycisphaerae bacterium]|nr:ATP-binding protein [Phycisphaerae bacterium]HNU46884.1 ATP-binding protein [Phycisphaerae bacterium]
MRRGLGKFFWKLFLGNALLLVAVVGLCVYLVLRSFDRFHAEDSLQYLRTHADLVRNEWEIHALRGEPLALEEWARTLGGEERHGIEVTLTDATGRVLVDTTGDAAGGEPLTGLPEIREALQTGWGNATRWSVASGRDLTYVARRVGPGDPTLGTVRVAACLRTVLGGGAEARQLAWRIVLIVVAAAVLLALGLARLWSRPIARITATARSLSEGNLASRAPISGADELAELGRALNAMRDHLAGQLETNYRQRRTLESLQAQLHEGVIVAAEEGRIVLINPAATRLLGLSVSSTGNLERLPELTVERVVPQHELQEMLQVQRAPAELAGPGGGQTGATGSGAVDERRVTIQRGGGEVTLLARATDIVLPGFARREGRLDVAARGGLLGEDSIGRLLVLTDITDLARTLQVKSDFVVNASHELRTPLAAIRAAVDTLLSLGADSEREGARRWLEVIARHCRRLEDLVRDLLDLSRLESGATRLEPAPFPVEAVLAEMGERLHEQLAGRKLHWHAEVAPECQAVMANERLLRLILDNLVDNAVKFTPDGGRIAVSCRPEPGGFVLCVEDTGCGIPPEEQSRVFERFYQVARSRSGAQRGTGLGLSIVRHAVAALGGTVTLESVVGQGTRITVRVPQPPAANHRGIAKIE